ncbi:MAG: glycosyltransferase family 2 protein [Bacteroidales bacterium]|nr:glycosyltransferase family 2 protein [Bacteroidales bacterium]
MDNSIVSIVIPVYNKARYIKECIEAIAKQTYLNIEVIVVDDGSTDESPAICDMLENKYSWMRVFHTQNRGVSAARNFGIKKAIGKWICFIDVDDYPLPTMLQKMVAENVDLVVCNWADENHARCSKILSCNRIECSMDKDEEFLLCTPDLFKNIWNKLYKTEIIKENAIFYEEEICHAEDALFAIDYYTALGKNSTIVLLGEPLYFHRRDVKGSLVKDHDVDRWKKTIPFWWKHVDRANVSSSVRDKMYVRCLQNEFFVCALSKDYKGLKQVLREKKQLINRDTVKCWSKLRQIVLLSKNPIIIYVVNRLWCRLR